MITAISQYDHYTLYPRLAAIKEQVQGRLMEAWERIHTLVGEDSYVADFFYSLEQDTAVLIKLSPFLEVTGPAMFQWTNPEDRAILFDGPLTFRNRQTAHPQAEELVEANWDLRRAVPGQQQGGALAPLSALPYWTQLQNQTQSIILSPQSLNLRLDGRRPMRQLQQAWMLKVPQWPSSIGWLARACFGWLAPLWLAMSAPWVFHPMGQLAGLTYLIKLGCAEAHNYSQSVCQDGQLLFVYGTLKCEFHWHAKYLGDEVHGAECLGQAITVPPLALVVGDSGVPYMLGDLVDGKDGQFRQGGPHSEGRWEMGDRGR